MAPHFMAALFLLASASCFAQQEPSEAPHLSVRTAPNFLLRIAVVRVTLDDSAHTCVIVFTDQSFHMEKWKKSARETAPKSTFVAEGMLTQEEDIQVASIVGDPAMEKLDASAVARKPFAFKKTLQEVFASIPRSSTKVQYLAAASVDKEEFSPTAKTLTKLVEAIEARKPPEVKNARHDDCKEPSPAKPLPR